MAHRDGSLSQQGRLTPIVWSTDRADPGVGDARRGGAAVQAPSTGVRMGLHNATSTGAVDLPQDRGPVPVPPHVAGRSATSRSSSASRGRALLGPAVAGPVREPLQVQRQLEVGDGLGLPACSQLKVSSCLRVRPLPLSSASPTPSQRRASPLALRERSRAAAAAALLDPAAVDRRDQTLLIRLEGNVSRSQDAQDKRPLAGRVRALRLVEDVLDLPVVVLNDQRGVLT